MQVLDSTEAVATATTLPEPTRAVVVATVVSEVPIPNAAVPAVPDAQLAVRTYVVEPGDSVRTIAQQFKVTNETIIWENDLTDPDVL